MAGKTKAGVKSKKNEEVSDSSEEVQEKPARKNSKGARKGKSREEETKAPARKGSKGADAKKNKKSEESESADERVAEYPPPKRALSAYLYFSAENRSKVVTNNPDAAPKDIMRLLSAAWKKCGGKDKERFEGMAEKDKERYERQKKEYEDEGKYYDDHGNVVKPEPKKRKSSKKKVEEKPGKMRKNN